MEASDIALRAADLIAGDRRDTHGDARQNFSNMAALWQTWLRLRFPNIAHSIRLTPDDVGMMMGLAKDARTLLGRHNVDDYIDGIGYRALVGAMAEEDKCGG